MSEKADIPIDPILPESFGDTPNDERPTSHQRWWNRPYIVTDTHEPESYEAFCERMDGYGMKRGYTREEWDATQAQMAAAFAERFPSGTRYSVYCLDGGAWDRPTCWGSSDTLEGAKECANNGPHWRR